MNYDQGYQDGLARADELAFEVARTVYNNDGIDRLRELIREVMNDECDAPMRR